jgi:hypothetical protein
VSSKRINNRLSPPTSPRARNCRTLACSLPPPACFSHQAASRAGGEGSPRGLLGLVAKELEDSGNLVPRDALQDRGRIPPGAGDGRGQLREGQNGQ